MHSRKIHAGQRPTVRDTFAPDDVREGSEGPTSDTTNLIWSRFPGYFIQTYCKNPSEKSMWATCKWDT